MREIKFRAWDDEIKSMFYSNTEQYDDSLLFRFKHFDTDEPIYMQYTGLKDKNGKEIFQGDILESEDGIDKVLFKKGAFVLESSSGLLEEPMYEFADTNYFGVIGNVYENPELLEK